SGSVVVSGADCGTAAYGTAAPPRPATACTPPTGPAGGCATGRPVRGKGCPHTAQNAAPADCTDPQAAHVTSLMTRLPVVSSTPTTTLPPAARPRPRGRRGGAATGAVPTNPSPRGRTATRGRHARGHDGSRRSVAPRARRRRPPRTPRSPA